MVRSLGVTGSFTPSVSLGIETSDFDRNALRATFPCFWNDFTPGHAKVLTRRVAYGSQGVHFGPLDRFKYFRPRRASQNITTSHLGRQGCPPFQGGII